MQRPAGDPVCWDPPACGYYTGFICRGFLLSMEAARERPEFDIRSPLGAPDHIFPQSYLLMSFPHGDTSAKNSGGLKSEFPYT